MSIERDILSLQDPPPKELRFFTAQIATSLLQKVERRRKRLGQTKKAAIAKMCELYLEDAK